MAVRKLTREQRDTLRSEIRTRLEAGEKLARVVADQASKYALSPFTVRWHVKKALSTSGTAKLRHRRNSRSESKPIRVTSKDRVLLRLKEEFDRLLEKDIEIRRAHVENMSQLQQLNLRISERLIQGLEEFKRRDLPVPQPGGEKKREKVDMPEGFESFGKRIKALRMASNLTLEEASKRVGTNKSYISGIENGKVSPPSVKFVAKFAQTYSVDEKELLRIAYIEKAPPALRDELLRAFWPKA